MCRLASRDSRYRLSGTGAVTAHEAVGIPPDRTVRHGTTGETYCVMTSGVDGPARSPGRRPRRNQMQPATPTLPCGAWGSRPSPGATPPGSGRRRRAASISPRERISPHQVPPQRFVPAVRPERPWVAEPDDRGKTLQPGSPGAAMGGGSRPRRRRCVQSRSGERPRLRAAASRRPALSTRHTARIRSLLPQSPVRHRAELSPLSPFPGSGPRILTGQRKRRDLPAGGSRSLPRLDRPGRSYRLVGRVAIPEARPPGSLGTVKQRVGNQPPGREPGLRFPRGLVERKIPSQDCGRNRAPDLGGPERS